MGHRRDSPVRRYPRTHNSCERLDPDAAVGDGRPNMAEVKRRGWPGGRPGKRPPRCEDLACVSMRRRSFHAVFTPFVVFFPSGMTEVSGKQGATFSVIVAIENLSGKRIGCLGEAGLSLSYRVRRPDGDLEILSDRERLTALTHDLTPGRNLSLCEYHCRLEIGSRRGFRRRDRPPLPPDGMVASALNRDADGGESGGARRACPGSSRSRHRFQKA